MRTFVLGQDPDLNAWEEEFLASNVPPLCCRMSIAHSGLFATLVVWEAAGFPTPDKEETVRNQLHGGLFQILENRLKVMGVPLKFPALLLVWSLCEGHVGNASIWAAGLSRLHRNLGKPLGIKELAEAFPVGFPTPARMGALWSMQKREGAPLGNMLDGVVPPTPDEKEES